MTDENLTPMPEEPVVPPAPPMPEPATEPGDYAPAAPAAEPYVPPAPEPVAAPEPPPYTPPVPPAPPQPSYSQSAYASPAAATSDKSKVVAGILGILLGGFGVHKFYLGYTKEGIIMAAITVLLFWTGIAAAVVGIIGLVEGIMYLTKSDAEFEATYVTGRKAWF